jgi:hypothetical protein
MTKARALLADMESDFQLYLPNSSRLIDDSHSGDDTLQQLTLLSVFIIAKINKPMSHIFETNFTTGPATQSPFHWELFIYLHSI